MNISSPETSYLRASGEMPAFGMNSEKRPEPSLEQARTELANSASRTLNHLVNERYGTVYGILSELTIEEFLKTFEASITKSKNDLTLIFQEILDRVLYSR